MSPQEIENLTDMMADDVREAFTEIDRLRAINAELIAACEAVVSHGDEYAAIVKCRAALASVTKVQP